MTQWGLNQARSDALAWAVIRNGFTVAEVADICRNRFDTTFQDMTVPQLRQLCDEMREMNQEDWHAPSRGYESARIAGPSEAMDSAIAARAAELGVPLEVAEQESAGERRMASQRSDRERHQVTEALGR